MGVQTVGEPGAITNRADLQPLAVSPNRCRQERPSSGNCGQGTLSGLKGQARQFKRASVDDEARVRLQFWADTGNIRSWTALSASSSKNRPRSTASTRIVESCGSKLRGLVVADDGEIRALRALPVFLRRFGYDPNVTRRSSDRSNAEARRRQETQQRRGVQVRSRSAESALPVRPAESQADLWAASRSGARAGRGFRYQDLVTALVVLSLWSEGEATAVVTPGARRHFGGVSHRPAFHSGQVAAE